MKKLFTLYILTLCLTFFCCNPSKKEGGNTTIDTTGTANEPVQEEPAQEEVPQVEAYIIFQDGTVADFDLMKMSDYAETTNELNKKPKYHQPYNKLKFIVTGKGPVFISVKGEKVNIDKREVTLDGKYEFEVDDGLCSDVKIDISNTKETLYTKTIEFSCGG